MKALLLLRIIFSAVVILVLASWAQSADASAAKQQLSVEQVKRDVALVKQAYEKIHPGYLRYTDAEQLQVAWDGIVKQAEQNGGMTLGDFYLSIQDTLTLIRCDHTKANLPKVLLDERNAKPMYLPFKWAWIEQRAFVTAPADESGLSAMDEILEIDGVPIKQRVEQVIKYVPYDGNTRWARLSGVSQSLEFKGGAVDHFGSLLWENKPTVELLVATQDGNTRLVIADRINHQQWSKLEEKTKRARNFKDAVTLERIGDKEAYLRIDTFVNYRTPVKPEDIYDPVFKTIKDEGRDTLILDLRRNGGGSSDASMGMLRNLIKENTRFKKDMRVNTLDFQELRQHMWTWDKRALNPSPQGFNKNADGSYSLKAEFSEELATLTPAKYAFSGKIIALTSNANSSGSTNLLAKIQDSGNVTLIGEKTGGNAEGGTAGVLFTLTLPESKITTRIPFFCIATM